MYDNRQQQFYLTKISFETKETLPTFEACSGYSVKIIRSLGPNKAHGHDEIFDKNMRFFNFKTTGNFL